jgi:hypothetical protein
MWILETIDARSNAVLLTKKYTAFVSNTASRSLTVRWLE